MTDKAKNKVDNGLVVNGIGKSYDDRSVLRDVNLKLNRGEVVAL